MKAIASIMLINGSIIIMLLFFNIMLIVGFSGNCGINSSLVRDPIL